MPPRVRPELIKYRDKPEAVAALLSDAFATNDLKQILRSLNIAVTAQNVLALSSKAGLRRDSIYKIIREDSNPSFKRILKLLKGLNVSIGPDAIRVGTASDDPSGTMPKPSEPYDDQ